MFNLFLVVSFVLITIEVFNGKTNRAISENARFDWDVYWNDVRSDMSVLEQVEKQSHGDYWVTSQPFEKPLNTDNVVDMKRYLRDIDMYGKVVAETWRKNGSYKYIRNCL